MLKQRVITAVVLAPIVIALVFLLTDLYFALFIGLVVAIGSWEWANIADFEGWQRYLFSFVFILLMLVAYNFIPANYILWFGAAWWALALVLVVQYPKLKNLWSGVWQRSLLVIPVLIPAWISMLQLKQYQDSSLLILLLIFLIWGADIGAYFTGRAFGKVKLAPNVSPGKSWEGLAGGVVSALVIVSIMMILWDKIDLMSMAGVVFLLICLTVILVSVLGDLTESMLKRQRGIKDSGSLLPGHGGILDRIDSIVAAAPIFALLLSVYGWQ